MRKIITADNSESFLNEEIGESYHSHKGAVEEALQKYVIPCKIREIAKTGKIRILDVCFGLGYNSAKAVECALEENPECEIEVIGLEYDPEIISRIQEVNPPLRGYTLYKKITPQKTAVKEGKVTIRVVMGDAREMIKKLEDNYFDAVFFDPFSPKTAPEMWQETFFREVWRVMTSKAVMATYSCARMARDNMSKAGLVYDDGPIWGRRGPGTIATKWV
ncbi:TPA: hypothetical protein HA241_04315 [Candidatus Woesearchaeota archaeon]|nr:hypothetical protein [Candidatus Woesearchaeota archaeon]